MKRTYAGRRSVAVVIAVVVLVIGILSNPDFYQTEYIPPENSNTQASELARSALDKLEVKGRASKTGYTREQFGGGWETAMGCDTRNTILRRDLQHIVVNTECQVMSGTLQDPYTGNTIAFQRGASSSQDVQIDHVVALSDAWQKGAQLLTYAQRVNLANDPLELLAVDGAANQQKGSGDAATWLPVNRAFRCQYISRQIAIKKKYALWVTQAEKDAMIRVLTTCPTYRLPVGA